MNRIATVVSGTFLLALLMMLPGYAAEDTTPPTVTDVSVDQSSIDTSSADQTVVATITVTDDLAGVYRVSMICSIPPSWSIEGGVSPNSGHRDVWNMDINRRVWRIHEARHLDVRN